MGLSESNLLQCLEPVNGLLVRVFWAGREGDLVLCPISLVGQ